MMEALKIVLRKNFLLTCACFRVEFFCVFLTEVCPGMLSEVGPGDAKAVLSDLSTLMRITNPLIHFLGQLLCTFFNWNCYRLS